MVDKTLKVTNRQRTDQGPYLDITSFRPALCLIHDTDYLSSVRIKFDIKFIVNKTYLTTIKVICTLIHTATKDFVKFNIWSTLLSYDKNKPETYLAFKSNVILFITGYYIPVNIISR